MKLQGQFVKISLNSINFWHWKVSILMPRGEQHGVSSHQGQRQPAKELAGHLSSKPLHLAKADASCFTCAVAPEWRPPNVSIAKGRNTIPSRRQASAVSLTFLCQAFNRAEPASAAAPATPWGCLWAAGPAQFLQPHPLGSTQKIWGLKGIALWPLGWFLF